MAAISTATALRDDHEAAIRVGVVHLREPGRPAVREELSASRAERPVSEVDARGLPSMDPFTLSGPS